LRTPYGGEMITSMDIMEKIAEQKIREAMEKGEFDHLALMGQPVEIEDLSHIPEDLRMGYHVLKNAHVIPEEMELRKEIASLNELIDYCTDDGEKQSLTRQVRQKILRFDLLMEKRHRGNAARNQYRTGILGKLVK